MDKESIQDRYLFFVGVMTQQAAGTDAILCWTLQKLTGIKKELAEAIFYTFDAFQTRRILIERVLVAIKADKPTEDLVDTIIRNAEKVNKRRAELAHATIGSTSTYPAGPVQFRAKLQTQKFRPVTDAYINSVLAEASGATQSAWQAYEALTQQAQHR